MEGDNFNKRLQGLLFPGLVKNEDKALECLGGLRGISQVYSQGYRKRLGLSFHPENPFAPKIFGDLKKSAGVLLRVRIKKMRKGNEVVKEVISTTVVGQVTELYRYESMCDFQYLPIFNKDNAGPAQCIVDKILPTGLDDHSFMTAPAPLHVVPFHFTRSDKPFTYSYTEKRYPDKDQVPSDEEGDHHIHRKLRTERACPLNRITFNLIDPLPAVANDYYLKRIEFKIKTNSQIAKEYEIIKKKLEERPIWSLNLLRFETKIKFPSFKLILPCLGVFMINGPWRSMWVRFGYDPRKEPGARIYQTLDFRIRHAAGVHAQVPMRDQSVHNKKALRSRGRPAWPDDGPEDVPEAAVRYRPGIIPSQRQIFFQYVDVQLPSVQAMLDEEPAPGYLCHPKRGWLPPSAGDLARNAICQDVKKTLFATNNADLKLEEGSSDDENSDGDEDAVNELEEP